MEGTLGERGAGGERGGADEAGTEDGERRRTDGKQRAERQVRDAPAVGTGELVVREEEEENGIGGTETRDGAEKRRVAACVVGAFVLVEGTNDLER